MKITLTIDEIREILTDHINKQIAKIAGDNGEIPPCDEETTWFYAEGGEESVQIELTDLEFTGEF